MLGVLAFLRMELLEALAAGVTALADEARVAGAALSDSCAAVHSVCASIEAVLRHELKLGIAQIYAPIQRAARAVSAQLNI